MMVAGVVLCLYSVCLILAWFCLLCVFVCCSAFHFIQTVCDGGSPNLLRAIISFAVPFLILGVPIFDICFAVLRRVAHGQSPMHADRGHIHHRLIDMGLNQKQAVAALYVISSILGLSAVVLTSSGAIKAMLFLMALAVAAFLASRVIFRRDIDKALQAERAAAEEKSTETATPAETVPAEPEEESNEKKKEEA